MFYLNLTCITGRSKISETNLKFGLINQGPSYVPLHAKRKKNMIMYSLLRIAHSFHFYSICSEAYILARDINLQIRPDFHPARDYYVSLTAESSP